MNLNPQLVLLFESKIISQYQQVASS